MGDFLHSMPRRWKIIGMLVLAILAWEGVKPALSTGVDIALRALGPLIASLPPAPYHDRAVLLLDKLEPREFESIRAFLHREGYEWENQGMTTIFVRPEVRTAAYQELVRAGLIPGRMQPSLPTIALRPGDPTGFDDDVREHAYSQASADARVMKLPYIRFALVQFSYPSEYAPLRKKQGVVIIEPEPGAVLTPDRIREIKSCAGLFSAIGAEGILLVDRAGRVLDGKSPAKRNPGVKDS